MPSPEISQALATAAEQMEKPWEEPIPLDRAQLPEFPVHALPARIGEHVQAVADNKQVPADLTGGLAIGAIAGALQRRYVVEIRPDFREHLCAWIMVVMDSGERKSPAYSAMLSVVYEHQAELVQRGKAARARALAELHSAEKRKETAIKAAAGAPPQSAHIDVAARDKAVDEVERLKEEVPPEPILLMDDVTPEQLGITLAGVGSVTIASSEGGGINNFLGRFNNKIANLDLILKSFSGDAASVHRVSRDAIHLHSPCVTFILTVQPDVLREAAQSREWIQRGASARFEYIIPAGRIGTRNGNGEGHPIPPGTREAYETTIRSLYAPDPPKRRASSSDKPTVLKFTAEARRLWEAWESAWEERLHPDTGDLHWCSAWGSKFPGMIARLATALQAAEHGPSDVTAEAMRNALEFAPYFEAHAVAAMIAADERPGVKDARRILRWIEFGQVERFTTRDAYKANLGRDTEVAADRTREALKILSDHYLIRKEDAKRADSEQWSTNPAVLQVSEVSDITNNKINSQKKSLPPSIPFSDSNHSIPVSESSSTPIRTKARTLRTLEDEAAPRFEAMPDAELDRFAPVDARELYDFEHQHDGPKTPVVGADKHDELPPEIPIPETLQDWQKLEAEAEQ